MWRKLACGHNVQPFLFSERRVYAKYMGNSQYLAAGSSAETAQISEAASANATNILGFYDNLSP